MERLTTSINGNVCYRKCTIDDVLEKLWNYENAEEEGLLLRLPCKPGDTVYYVCKVYKKIFKDEIRTVKTKNGTVIIETVSNGFMWGSEFGKTLFLIDKEAEKALAELVQ